MLSGQGRPAERQQDGKAEPVGSEPSHPHAGKRELDGFREGSMEGGATWITQSDVPGRIVGDVESGRGKAFPAISAPARERAHICPSNGLSLRLEVRPFAHAESKRCSSRTSLAEGG